MKAAAKVCAFILVITYFCEQCYSLRINYEHEESNEFKNDEDLFAPDINSIEKFEKDLVAELPKQQEDNLLYLLLGDKLYEGKKDIENNRKVNEPNHEETAAKRRVTRQAYSGQATLYPKLPSNPPYNQYQPYYNNNNQSPPWQPPNNYSQHGYPSNGVSNFYPSSAQQNSTYGHNPYNPGQGQNVYNSNNPSSPSLPGYRPPNATLYNSGQSRPPYNSQVQFNNNTYPGYQTPVYPPGHNPYNPTQRPPYSPTTPSRHPVTYDPTSNKPYNNQNVRPSYNVSNGLNSQYFNSYPNNPNGKPNSTFPHNVPTTQGPYHNTSSGAQYPTYNNNNAVGNPYGQNPQNFNSYPQGPNQNPYNNPYNGQNAGGSNYLSTSNHTNGYIQSGYTPNQPPYGSGPGQNNIHYPPPPGSGTAHDPTKVSPQYFSYPHQ